MANKKNLYLPNRFEVMHECNTCFGNVTLFMHKSVTVYMCAYMNWLFGIFKLIHL